jgi:type IV secretory pathway component VirB8
MNQQLIARALREEEQASFKDNLLSWYGEIDAANKRTRRVVFFAGGAMLLAGTVGLAVGCAMFVMAVNKPPQTFFNSVDTTTGYIGPSTPAADAPQTFNEQTNQYWIRQFVELREGYHWELDQKHFDRIQIMMCDDERLRYVDWHKKPLSPAQKLQKHGYVDINSVHADRVGEGKAKTLEYTIHFDRTEINGQSIGPVEHVTGDIQFQWHPDLMMNAEQRANNPGGFIACAYHGWES